jgi:hypothetical protein
MKRWIRVVLPSEIYILAACACYLFVSVSSYLLDLNNRINGRPLQASVAGLLVLVACAFAYGIQRVKNFHPACQAEYRNWLRTTPWHAGLPLPIGPVHLILQDLLIVGLMTGLSSLHAEFRWYIIPSSFLIGYLMMMICALVLTRRFFPAYLILVGLGGVVYLQDSPLGLSVIFTILYVIAWAGQRDSLRDFEQWDMYFFDERIAPLFKPQGVQELSRSWLFGWPYDRLSPQRNQFALPWKFSLALAGLVGWWWFVLIERVAVFGGSHVTGLGLPIAGFLSFSRLWAYCWGYAPPLSFAARIFKLRWIIPGYDVVFLAPILMSLWAVATIGIQFEWAVPASLIGPVQIAGLILINAFCPPSLDAWRLTGNHRIVAATSQSMGELQETK